MALSQDLAQFAQKSSGVYRLEFDKSQTATVPAEQIRLVVGFSKKGPFQTPIFVPDTGFFQEVYGKIDRGLERKGAYFHRTAFAALERGPILALNLLRLNNDEDSTKVDTIEYQTLSASACTENPDEKTALYSGFYNKDRFWFPSTSEFLENIGDLNSGLIQFTNLNQRPVSIIVRHANNINGFNITAKEWYGKGNVPEFMHENDYIRDFMVDVIVVEGEWTDYEKLSIDPLFGKYFDKTKGLIKSELPKFLQDSNVNILSTYTGSLIPDFIDLQGNNMFIESLVNFDTSISGLFCSVDKKLFDEDLISGVCEGIDMIGHNIEHLTNEDDSFNKLKFLSYDRVIKDDLEYPDHLTKEIEIDVNTSEDISFVLPGGTESQTPPTVNTGANASKAEVNYSIKIGITGHSQFESELDGKIFTNEAGKNTSRKVGSYVLMTNSASDDKWVPVVSITAVSGVYNIGLCVEEIGYEIKIDSEKMFFVSSPDWSNYNLTEHNFSSAKYNGLYDDYIEGTITTGDKVHDATQSESYFLKFTNMLYGKNPGEVMITDNISHNSALMSTVYYSVPVILTEAFDNASFDTPQSLPLPATDAYYKSDGFTKVDNLLVQSLTGKLNVVMDIDKDASSNLPANEVYISKADYNNSVKVFDYLVSDEIGPNGESRLTKINRIVSEGPLLRLVTDAPMRKTDDATTSLGTSIERYREIESVIEHYKFFGLSGFKLDSKYHMPDNTQLRIDDIYKDTLGTESNLFNALIDKENITYRYIVDSFGLGIQSESKHQLSVLAKKRQNATAILNAPSMEDFKKSTSPKFVDRTGSLSARFIAEGGDLSLNPEFVYSLPNINNGANYCTFYTPYVTVRDRGKNITYPPAGLVSNNFVDKYINALPWSIVAGPRRGVITGTGVVGLEINFNKNDRDNLEPFGLNPIIFQRGIGLMISGNKTAQQSPKSALSSVHVREVLIYMEDGIAEILKDYQFEFNTPQTRLEIKTLADNFLRGIQQDQGIYAFDNVMDESNNTGEVIDNNIGVLDTFIEPVKGLEVLIHRTTVLKTGAISTGQYR